MAYVLIHRLLQTSLILFGVAAITFILLYALPADPARMIAGRSATAQTVANIRHELGLDQSLLVQFWHYLGNLFHGNFGRSYAQKTDVGLLLLSRLPATLVLMASGIATEVLLGTILGVAAAVKRGSFIDNLVMMTSFVGVSAPQFVVALLLLYVFAVTLGWFPMSGYGTWAHVVLPATTLGVLGAGWYARMVRSAMIDVLNQDYVRTARAKGVSARVMTYKHAFRNAALPILTVLGGVLGGLLSGAVLTETIFSWPGIGRYATEAAVSLDFPAIMGVTLVAGLAYSLINLLVDLLYATLDPRISYG